MISIGVVNGEIDSDQLNQEASEAGLLALKLLQNGSTFKIRLSLSRVGDQETFVDFTMTPKEFDQFLRQGNEAQLAYDMGVGDYGSDG